MESKSPTFISDEKVDLRKTRDFKNKPNKNNKTFKYKVYWTTQINQEETKEVSKNFKNVKDIENVFDIKKSSVYILLSGKSMRKYKGFRIEKINIPARETIYFE